MDLPIISQWINLLASLGLLLSFAMLSQRRLVALIRLFIFQGLVLALCICLVATQTSQHELYYSAALTFGLKVVILPFVLYRLMEKLNIKQEIETLLNIPTISLLGILVVIFAFNLALPITQIAHTITRSVLGIALANILLSFLMMITRRKAIPQVIGFLSMENGLLFAATSATYGMPLAVELGIALDILIGMVVFGIFFFHIRETFDSLDLRQFDHLKDE